jgi:hypothetical protein
MQVDAGIGLAEAGRARLHEGVEEGAQLVVRARLAFGLPVVGERSHRQAAAPKRVDGAQHHRARGAGFADARHHRVRGDRVTGLGALALEGGSEGREAELAALEPRPGPLRAARYDDAVDVAHGDAQLALVASDGVKGRVEDDPAQVEDHGAIASRHSP